MKQKIEKILIYVIEIIFILILSFLTIESIFKTCTIDNREITSYEYDHPIVHVITVGITILIFMFINKKKVKINKKWLWILIGIFTLMFIGWILVANVQPTAYKKGDQNYIYEIAEQMRKGVWEAFEQGKYAAANPHQYGLILYEYVLGFIFGSKNYIAIQLLNLGALLLSFFCIYKITRKMFKNRETSVVTIIALLLFIPIWFYITFMYGNLLGLACSMVAILAVLNYLDTKKIRFLILSSISMGLAIVFKSNYLITLVAIICMLLLEMLERKQIRPIIAIALLIVGYLIIKTIIPVVVQKITQKEEIEVKGIPMIAYVEMGLQEGKRAPGWYNGYNRKVYRNNKYDNKKTEEVVKKDIKNSIQSFSQNPKYAVEFFYKKTVSEWNNPTFQSFWIGRKVKEKPFIVRAINGHGRVNAIIVEYMNIIQTIILVGATAFMIINFKTNQARQLIFAIILIGGFLFHLIWEAKGQYTITYFILLIPYAVRGYVQMSIFINEKLNKHSNKATMTE